MDVNPSPGTIARERCVAPDEGTTVAPFRWSKWRCEDADEHAESLAAWDQRYEQLSAGAFAGDLAEAWLDGVQIFRERTNRVVFQAGRSWPGALALGLVEDARGEAMFFGRPVRKREGFLCGPTAEFSLRTPERFDVLGIAVSAGALLGEPAGPAVLPDSAALGRLRLLVAAFFEQAEADAAVFEQPQARRSFISSLLDGLAALGRQETEASLPGGRLRLVAEAQRYVQDHPSVPLTVADLCAVTGASRRTLQYCFRERLGVSPVQYLKAFRLNGVRRELKGSDTTQRVADIAARWGFWHASQFAADYRRMFGELPSQTLARHRR